MVNYLISVLPIFIYLVLLVFFDVFSLVRRQRLLQAFIWGFIVCLWLYLLSSFSFFESISGLNPVFEELLKFALIVWLFKRDRIAFLSDSLIYGATVGTGFAFLENIIYASVFNQEPLVFYIYRGFATSLLHFGTTAFASSILLVFSKWSKSSFWQQHPGITSVVAIAPSTVMHVLHNSFKLSPNTSFAIVLLCTIVSFALLLLYNQHYIHSWLESSLNDEVQLADSFRRGEFASTNAGKYLLSVKQQFDPLVYFDMAVYINLYLDLSLSAKGFIMMQEMEIPIAEKNREEYKEKLQEFYTLRHNIGRTATLTLAPIVDRTKVDAIINLFN